MPNNNQNKKSGIELREHIRTRTKNKYSIRESVKSPISIVLVLLLVATAVFLITWDVKDEVVIEYLSLEHPLVIKAVLLILNAVIIAVTLVIILSALMVIGIPKGAKEVENDLAVVFKDTEEYEEYKKPILLSKKVQKQSGMIKFIFWARWIDITVWEHNRNAVLGVLNANSKESFKNENNSTWIISIMAYHGATPPERETPKDPLF